MLVRIGSAVDNAGNWILTGAIPFAIGWVISVERRISSLMGIKDRVERIDTRVGGLYDHLIGKDHEPKN